MTRGEGALWECTRRGQQFRENFPYLLPRYICSLHRLRGEGRKHESDQTSESTSVQGVRPNSSSSSPLLSLLTSQHLRLIRTGRSYTLGSCT